MKTMVIASGFFDPLHIGHVEYLEEANELGDRLLVIVSRDKHAILKKGYVFMPELERIQIIGALRCVDQCFFSIDDDITIRETLKVVHRLSIPEYTNFIFAKGGDRTADEIPEAEVCKELGIKIVDGLGAKIQSSSDLISNLAKNQTDLPPEMARLINKHFWDLV